MNLSREEVNHIADLARLELSEEEKIRYQEQLSVILDHAAHLQELDTSLITPTSSVLPARSVLRSDDPLSGLSPEDLLRNAPQVGGNQIRVPSILD